MEGDFSKRFVFFFSEVDEFSCYMSKFRIIQINFGFHGMLSHEVKTYGYSKKVMTYLRPIRIYPIPDDVVISCMGHPSGTSREAIRWLSCRECPKTPRRVSHNGPWQGEGAEKLSPTTWESGETTLTKRKIHVWNSTFLFLSELC